MYEDPTSIYQKLIQQTLQQNNILIDKPETKYIMQINLLATDFFFFKFQHILYLKCE